MAYELNDNYKWWDSTILKWRIASDTTSQSIVGVNYPSGTDKIVYFGPVPTTGGTPAASDVTVDASSFTGNLSATDTDVQTAMDTIDAMTTSGGDVLTANTTINLTSSMTSSDIQTLIDAQPKNLGHYVLTIQFADGTYTLDTAILFSDFCNGSISVYGNATDNSLSATKLVNLNFANNTDGLSFTNIVANILIQYIRVNLTTNTYSVGISVDTCDQRTYIRYCALSGNTISFPIGIQFRYTNGFVGDSMFSTLLNTISSLYVSHILSFNNDDAGTLPTRGLSAENGGVIAKNGLQPSGTTSEYTATGGVIR